MLKQIALATALAIAASSSFADERYVGADVGSSRLNNQAERHDSYGFYLGYDLAPTFAVEFSARRLGDFKVCCQHSKIDQAAVSLIGAIPLGELSIYGRVGYNKLKYTPKLPHS